MRKTTIFNKLPGYFFLFFLLIPVFLVQPIAQTNKKVSDTSSIVETDSASLKKNKKNQDITDTIHYEAEKIDYDSEKKILLLVGKSMVQYQNILLNADTIVYDINQNLFTASGLPKLIDGKDTTIGEMMIYNIKTRRGRVQFASTHMDDGYFNGRNIMKTGKDEIYVNEGDYTTCAVVDTPHFFFYGKNIKVVPKKEIISRPVVLNIGNAPVAVLPYFIFPIERNRRSGLLTPSWGGHPTGGGYVDNIGYYYAPNDFVDFLARAKVMDFSEFEVGASSQYALKYKLHGGITARTVLNSDFMNSSRQWALDYNHFQNITPDGLTTLSGRGNLVSDSKYNKNNSEDADELTNQNMTANLSLYHRFEKINASGNITWNRTDNLQAKNLNEELPSFNFSLPNRPLIPAKADAKEDETRWFNKIYYQYDTKGLLKHTFDTDLGTETYHPGLTHNVSLSSPQNLFKWITINPSLNAHLSSFNGYLDTTIIRTDTLRKIVHDTLTFPFHNSRSADFKLIKADTISRDILGAADTIVFTRERTRLEPFREGNKDTLVNNTWWNAQVDLSTKLYGIFPIHLYNFAGLRHTFTPTLRYSYVPEHRQNKMFYDIGIPYDRGHERQQILSLSFDNQFDGKILKPGKEGEKPAETKLSLLSVGLSTSHDFEAKSRKWRDLNLSASTGVKMVRLTYSSSYWFYDEHDQLSLPIMKDMRFSLSTGSLGAHGSLWGGNILELDSLQKHFDSESHGTTSGPQKWEFSFTPSYSFSMSRPTATEMFIPDKQYSLSASASINFTPNWSVNWSGDYNFTENQWVRNSINVHCDLECWDMQFQWRPETLNPGYYFRVNIKKIPEIKWEQRR